MQGPDDKDYEDPEFEQEEEDDASSLAEDAADGAVCSLCGALFVASHGYPVLCKDCWKDESNRTEGLQEATESEVNG